MKITLLKNFGGKKMYKFEETGGTTPPEPTAPQGDQKPEGGQSS